MYFLLLLRRNLANNLLAKSSTTGADKTHDDSAKIKSEEDEDKEEGEETDSVYINSYSNYSIHLEMLQVFRCCYIAL